MYGDHLEWKQKHAIDNCLKEFEFHEKAQVLELNPKGYVGVDKVGRPIYVERCGHLKLNELLQAIAEPRLLMSIYQSWEHVRKVKYLACSHKAQK